MNSGKHSIERVENLPALDQRMAGKCQTPGCRRKAAARVTTNVRSKPGGRVRRMSRWICMDHGDRFCAMHGIETPWESVD